MTEKNLKEWAEDITNNNYGNLDYPLPMLIKTPLCKICRHSDYHYGTWDEPECLVLKGEENAEYTARRLHCKEYKCTNFEVNPNSKWLRWFDKDYNPIIK